MTESVAQVTRWSAGLHVTAAASLALALSAHAAGNGDAAAPPAAAAAAESTASPQLDERIRAEVVQAIADDPQTPVRDLRVVVQDGTVTLYGQVSSSAHKHLAARYANDVPGTAGVVNVIRVRPAMRLDDAAGGQMQ